MTIESTILACLERPISFNVVFARITGSAIAGLMLSQAWYWRDKGSHDKDGWFHKTQAEWEKETFLSRREQETARKVLRSKGFLEENLSGNPARLWFRVNRKKILQAIEKLGDSQYGGNEHTSMAESAKQECTNPPNKHGGKRHALYSETTTENTNRDYTESADNMSNQDSTSESRTQSEASQRKSQYEESANEIFEFWKAATGHSLTKFVGKRKTKVIARLKDGYTVNQIKLAIEGNAESDFHRGINDRRTRYDSLELICRDPDKLESFINMRGPTLGVWTHTEEDGGKHEIDVLREICKVCGEPVPCGSIHQNWLEKFLKETAWSQTMEMGHPIM